MTAPRSLARTLAAVLVAVAATPRFSVAATEQGPPATPPTVDVELRDGGVLVGQLLGADGAPAPKKPVTVQLADGTRAQATTNDDGGFAFRGVRGVAHLESGDAQLVVRGWSPGVAPPSALPAVLLVEPSEVTRGQYYAGPATQGFVDHSKRLMANPLFVAGVVATAVAIPVAIHNAGDDKPRTGS